MIRLLAIISFLLLSIGSFAQEASASLQDLEIKIGEQTEIELELRFQAAEEVIIMPELKDTISQFIQVIDVSEIDTTFDEEDITTKIFYQKITITSWDSGFHAIPPFTFKVGKQLVTTQPLLLTVNTVELAAEADIKDIKGIIEVPFSLSDWILAHKTELGLVLLAILLVAGGIIAYLRYKNRPVEAVEKAVPKEAADALAIRKLNELEAKALWQKGDVKGFYVELSFILREYLGNRYEMHVLEHTTEEIISLIRGLAGISDDWEKKVHQTLMLADMAKFAKQVPLASENETAFKNTYQFVEITALKVEVAENKEEEVVA